MLLKLCCVVLPLMFLNEVRLVTPANTTAMIATPSFSAAKMTANTKPINGTSIQPNNGTVTNSAGTMQHGGSSAATTLALMTIASFTVSVI